MRKIRHIRWLIGGMLFLAAILNYIDRQALSLLAPTIQKDLQLGDDQYASIVNYFLIAYTVSLLLSGRLVDKLGTRVSMALFVGWWSISNMLTGLARTATSLGAFRAMLGFGEAGNWPSSTKAVAEWFPPKERAFAIGFYTMGATLGATIAPLLIIWLVSRWHWQAAFVATGAMGMLWVLPWLWLYRPPGEHPRITDDERLLIAEDAPQEPATTEATEPANHVSELQRWQDALSRREVWLLLFGRLMTDPLWFFYQFWFAKYLTTDRHLSQSDLKLTWVIYLAADLGAIAGGLLSGYFIKRGTAAVPARLRAMLLSAVLMPASALVTQMPSLGLSLTIAAITVLAHLAWLSNISALVVDLIPKSLVATCFGLVAAGSAVGGITMNKVVVYFVQNHSYAGWFAVMACLHPAAWLLLWVGGIGRQRTAAIEMTATT